MFQLSFTFSTLTSCSFFFFEPVFQWQCCFNVELLCQLASACFPVMRPADLWRTAHAPAQVESLSINFSIECGKYFCGDISSVVRHKKNPTYYQSYTIFAHFIVWNKYFIRYYSARILASADCFLPLYACLRISF